MKPQPKRKVTPGRVIEAIKGSGGIKRVIIDRLECNPWTLDSALSRKGPRWDDVRMAFKMEQERVGDLAEKTIHDSMRQRIDLSVASTTARWFLDRKHVDRGYGKKDQLTVEGGKVPLQVQTVVPIAALNLPLELKKQLLEAIEQYEQPPEPDQLRG